MLIQKHQSIISTISYHNKNDVYSGKEFAQQNWLNNRLAISDNESETSAKVKEFADALVPQKQQKRFSQEVLAAVNVTANARTIASLG